ncbi:hypothetical protein NLM59_02955 [Weeksellaceae bacterium KMM 9724]|uniref:hypothetical protein n=1 Tax=Profundicola chukchiensis TaxID=2961959 RepID=UPI00243E3AC6|nr:hypothetical protein [Profundicola chukchiensis]MDG4949872.1 hypothetical protein [Profundicola chukchiensis]
MSKIIISPLFEHYMSGRIWMGLDSEAIKKELIEVYNHEVELVSFREIVENLNNIPHNSSLFYSGSYNKSYLQYIQDTIHLITVIRPDIHLLPNYEQVRSLENKGFQEYLKMICEIQRVRGKYYGDINDLIKDKNKMSFPFVLKLNEGALSSGVQLINNEEELLKFQSKLKTKSIKDSIAYRINKFNNFKGDHGLKPISNLLEQNFIDSFQKRTQIVTQEFIPGLNCDYKVLVFGDKYYVLRRGIRENDFRASGSGKFEWVEAPREVLDYAENIVNKLKTPFVSLDIGIDIDNNCYLFEYQGVAFGPLTLIGSDRYYINKENQWECIEERSDLEKSYAYAIDYHIKSKA